MGTAAIGVGKRQVFSTPPDDTVPESLLNDDVKMVLH